MGWIIQQSLFPEKMEKRRKAKRASEATQAWRKKSVFAFNHIDTKNKERLEELQKLFKFYHKLWFCYKMVYARSKKVLLALNLVSVSLVAVRSIVGGVTMNPVILGVISGAGVVLKTAMEMKNPS